MNQVETYPQQKLAYTVNESLKILRVSRATLYRIMNGGTLKTKKVGGRRLITHKEITRFLEAE